MKARMLLARGTFDPDKLRIVWHAFDLAWAQIAPGVGSSPQAIEAARMKLSNITLEATKDLEDFDAAGLAKIILGLMYVEPTELGAAEKAGPAKRAGENK